MTYKEIGIPSLGLTDLAVADEYPTCRLKQLQIFLWAGLKETFQKLENIGKLFGGGALFVGKGSWIPERCQKQARN